MPAIVLARKVKLKIQQFLALVKENSGTLQILGIPSGLKILNKLVKMTPNVNWANKI